MNISIQATITLSQADITEALKQYVSNNGFDLEGKDVEFPTDLPESVKLTIDGTDAPQLTETKTKAKSKAQPKPTREVTPKETPVVAAEEDTSKEEKPQDTPAFKKGPTEEEKAAASAEVQAAIEKTQKLLEAKPDPEETKSANPFAKLNQQHQDTDQLDPANDEDFEETHDDDQPLGQDILDEEEAPVKTGKAANPFANEPKIDAEPQPRRATASKLFG
ncbi:TPA: hypothetical protein ACGIKE_003428 [Acinetobacter baumannii]|uniref:hypothetical protein n=1 Tax=Acinetobacter baumannii TaxID=470 RepID=UPI00339052A6